MLCSRFFESSVDLTHLDEQHAEKGKADEDREGAHYAHEDDTDGDWPRVPNMHAYNYLET